MRSQNEPEIIVAGTGPIGLLAALGLAGQGVRVLLVGPEARTDDRRTTALMKPAVEFLDRLGLLDDLAPKAAPLEVMRIVDATDRLIRSPVVTFRASEIGEDYFGMNIPNADLNATLEQAVQADSRIEWTRSLVETWTIDDEQVLARLANGDEHAAKLAVAADGRLSAARKAAGISTSSRDYPQTALVLNFGHSRPHGSISTEFHTETGPFTQVPLPGNRSSLVWVVEPNTAKGLASLDDGALSRLVEERMHSMLGRVDVEPGLQLYPLTAVRPKCFAKNRVALVGEAAHVFPPIGAQGMNLGIRDLRDLIDMVLEYADDPGAPAALRAYDRKRRPDILARSGAVNILNLSLLTDMIPAQLARSAALGMVGGFAPLRALFMREGLQPGSGLASMFSPLGEQIRR